MTVRAVATTGIYCRPDCVARPDPRNVEEFPLYAAAEAAGYRACHRCRPYRDDAPPGVIGPELLCTAVRMVCEGALDEGTEDDLAAGLGVSTRHLRRLFGEHLGTTPDGLARSRRAHFARRLLDETDLSITDVAFASGYGSLRQLQRACVTTFGEPPSALRARRRASDHLESDTGLRLRLWHAGSTNPGQWRQQDVVLQADGSRTVIETAGASGTVEVWRGGPDHLVVQLDLPDWRGLVHVVRHVRRLVGLDDSFGEDVAAGIPVPVGV